MPTLNQILYKFQQYRMLFDEVIKSSGLHGEALQEIKVCTSVRLNAFTSSLRRCMIVTWLIKLRIFQRSHNDQCVYINLVILRN